MVFATPLLWGLATPAVAADAIVTDIRVGKQDQQTRLVLELSGRIAFNAFTLADPYRVVIDLPEVGWRLPARPLPARTGLLKSLRYGLFKPGTTRIVLDVTGPTRISQAFLLDPGGAQSYRLVLDMAPTTRQAMLGKPQSKPPTAAAIPPKPVQKASLPFAPPLRKPAAKGQKPKPRKRVIIIDPGHGGVDPGTLGRSGTYEKHVTLSAARALKQHLEKTGRYTVKLTRNRDVFIRLRDRVAIARDAGGELFISVHADAIKNRNIRGLSVYTLSERASDKEAAALADKENKADLIAGIDLSNESQEVTNILIDLAQRESMNQSARFAASLVKDLRKEVKVLRNTHRFAGFAVLKAPDIPSILVELGFLSNRQDEKELRTKSFRRRLARGMLTSIDAFFARIEEAQRR